ncbi:MAG: PSP1 C-terminal domain-containing protein [Pirellulales bacterium]
MSNFSRQHLVQVGLLGQIGRFTSVDAVNYRRGMQVICRTSRGTEIGNVLSPVNQSREGESDRSILRGVTVEDHLLISRLDKNKQEAFAACQTELVNRKLEATLIETEQLFDGQSIYFYFLGEVSAEVEQVTQELAKTYDSVAGISQFSDILATGCGPDCGTEDGSGCGDSCISCSISSACKTSSH